MIKHVFSINLEKIYTELLGQIRKCIFWSIEILPSNANPFLPFCLVFLKFLAFFIYHDRLWRIGCSNMSFPWLIPFRAANHPLPFRFIFCLFVFFWLKMTFWLSMYLCLDNSFLGLPLWMISNRTKTYEKVQSNCLIVELFSQRNVKILLYFVLKFHTVLYQSA